MLRSGVVIYACGILNCALQFYATSDKLLMTHGAYFRWCQMTADCTTVTTIRTNTAVTATPATAEVDVH